MISFGNRIVLAAIIFCCGLPATHLVWGHGRVPGSASEKRERARIVLSQPLAKLDGNHLKVVLVEVNYGPGESSAPHSHPCSVIGYVIEGTIRTRVKGEPEMTYKTGESFYEAPNGVHLISANASSTESAKLIAYLICDHDAPLSVDVPASIGQKGATK